MLGRLHGEAVASASWVFHGSGSIGKKLSELAVAREELSGHKVSGDPWWEVLCTGEEALHSGVRTSLSR